MGYLMTQSPMTLPDHMLYSPRALALLVLVGVLAVSGCSKEPEQKPQEPKVEKKTPQEPEEPVAPLARERAHSQGKAELVGVDRMDVAMMFASALEAAGDVADDPPEDQGQDNRPRIKMQERATGSIDAKAAGRVFARYNVAMKRCYERSLKRNPGLEGKVELNLVVNTNGKVRRASARGRSLNDDMVNKCIEGNALRMEFPPPKGGIARLSKAYTFTPEI
ncbi:MAG: AgmX/PglI C-terminal domain-containing protein [Myxococcota bacterium]